MIDIRIVCTHDALQLAEKLARVLSAEQHNVQLCYGRQSLDQLEAARSKREAVILIWSFDAPSAHYMLQWAQSTDPTRLVELARAPAPPRVDRLRAKAVDFSAWNGERGGSCWRGLMERLSAVRHVLEPPAPAPKRALLAVGMAGAALGGALFMHTNKPLEPTPAPTTDDLIAGNIIQGDGLGGPLNSIEPADASDRMHFGPFTPRVQMLSAPVDVALADAPVLEPIEINRETTFLSRLADLTAPLRGEDRNDRD